MLVTFSKQKIGRKPVKIVTHIHSRKLVTVTNIDMDPNKARSFIKIYGPSNFCFIRKIYVILNVPVMIVKFIRSF